MTESPRYFQYSESDTSISSYISRYGNMYDDDDDFCDVCETHIPQYNCNKCGNSICGEVQCCMTFPHYSNTTYFVCSKCVDKISLKLVLLIDLGKLKLLKEKIRTGTTRSSVCSSRTTSISTCSLNDEISSISSTVNSDDNSTSSNVSE